MRYNSNAAVASFLKLGINAANAVQEPFNTFFARVTSGQANQDMHIIAQLLSNELLRKDVNSGKADATHSTVSPKAMLSAYLCLTPNFLDTKREEEKTLATHCKDLIQHFESIVTDDSSDEVHLDAKLHDFETAWVAYAPLFDTWRAGGTSALLYQAASTYKELIASREHISESGFQNMEDVLSAIDNRVQRLQQFVQGLHVDIEAYGKLEPDVRVTLRALLAESFADIHNAISDEESPDENENVGAEQQQKHTNDAAVRKRLEKQRVLTRMAHDAACSVIPTQLHTLPSSSNSAVHNSYCPSVTDSFVQSLSQYKPPATVNVPDPFIDRRMEAFTARIKEQAERALWDCITIELSSTPPVYDRLEGIVEELATRLIQLCGKDEVLVREIRSAMNWSELAKSLTMQTMVNFVRYVCGKIQYLDAPVNSEATKNECNRNCDNLLNSQSDATQAAHAIVGACKFLYSKIINVQKLADAHKINILQPYLKSHALDIEQQWVQLELSLGTMTLQRTQKFITDLLAAFPAVMANRFTDNQVAEGLQQLLINGIVALLQQHVAVSLHTVPESLMLDVRNLTYLQQVIQCTVLLCCMLHITQALLKQSMQTQLTSAEVAQFKEIVAEEFRNPETSLPRIASAVELATQSILSKREAPTKLQPDVADALMRMVVKTANTTDPVYVAFHAKFINYLKQLVSGKATDDRSNNFAPYSFDEVNFVGASAFTIARHNCLVWNKHYKRIAAAVQQPSDASDDPSEL